MNKFICLICIVAGMPLFSTAQDSFSINEYANFTKYDSANLKLKELSTHPKIVFMGNSITEGWVSMRPDFFNENNFEGRGIGGQVSHQMLLRFQADVIDLVPEAVVILAGTNDLAQNSGAVAIDQIMNNIKSMSQLAQSNDIAVALCSVLPAKGFPWSPKVEPVDLIIELNKRIKDYCDRNHLVYVDYYHAMADHEGGLKVPDYTAADDLVHPNVTGYMVMESVLLSTLKPWFD